MNLPQRAAAVAFAALATSSAAYVMFTLASMRGPAHVTVAFAVLFGYVTVGCAVFVFAAAYVIGGRSLVAEFLADLTGGDTTNGGGDGG